ncbi:hypothetical protein SMA5143A_4894 [Streptomyces sp. MA5143a]|nr:hypothetical protein SMA5143A_4894 [Streptomyces sp. MA5143a]
MPDSGATPRGLPWSPEPSRPRGVHEQETRASPPATAARTAASVCGTYRPRKVSRAKIQACGYAVRALAQQGSPRRG